MRFFVCFKDVDLYYSIGATGVRTATGRYGGVERFWVAEVS